MLAELTPRGPGEGPHWERLALWLHDQMSVVEVDGVWVFRVLRRDANEYGTAVLSRVEGDRRRIYTATYVATIKGKKRGGFEATLEEIGSGPLEALRELLELVPVRADDEDPPVPVDVDLWFPPQVVQEELPFDAGFEPDDPPALVHADAVDAPPPADEASPDDGDGDD
jgi:hypothetical protein